MAFTTYRTWVASETLTAAMLNAQIRDNGNLTPAALATTKGDTFVATAANAVTRLAVGGTGAPLVSDPDTSTGVRWANTNKTASGGVAVGMTLYTQMTAADNGDDLYALHVSPTAHKSTYTGLLYAGILVAAGSADGAGTIDNAYGVYIAPPTIGTTNWPLYVTSGNSFFGGPITTSMASTEKHIILSSSGVAHGITDYATTNSFGTLGPADASIGSLSIQGLSEQNPALLLSSYAANAADTTKTTSATGSISVNTGQKSGTGVATIGANGNIIVFKDAGTTRFILDADGDSHQDVGTAWTNFDAHDDAELLTALSVQVSRAGDPIKKSFGKFLSEHREKLEALKLVTFNDDGHHFMNMSKLTMLLVGAVRQQAARWEETAGRLAQLETRLLQAGV